MAKSINIAFPLQDDKDNNIFFKTTKTTKEAITSDFILLLMTNKGERWFNPDYGCDIRKYIFQPNDEINDAEIKQSISNDVNTFMPNLTINELTVTENSTNAIGLFISFTYTEDFFTFSNSANIRLTA